ncbi:hypothetical protein KBC80_03835, partial [Candidatus Woesebacteria bacterium]|nr:hypothetical protein [Candidatus Woesebacteria bacterium]
MQLLPLVLLMVFAATTFFIVARIQTQRTGELRQFAAYNNTVVSTPKPIKTPIPSQQPLTLTGCKQLCQGSVSCENACKAGVTVTSTKAQTKTPVPTKTTIPTKTPTLTVAAKLNNCVLSCKNNHACEATCRANATLAVTPTKSVSICNSPTFTAAQKANCLRLTGLAGTIVTTTPRPTITVTVTIPPNNAFANLIGDPECSNQPGVFYNKKTGQCVPINGTPMQASLVPTSLPSFCWWGWLGTSCKSTPTPTPSPVASGTQTTVKTPSVTVTPTIAAGQKCFPNCRTQCANGSSGLFGGATCNPPPVTPTVAPVAKKKATTFAECMSNGGGAGECRAQFPIVTAAPPKVNPTVTNGSPVNPTPSVTPVITPIIPVVPTKLATTITPSPSVKPKALVSCGGITEGNVATGEQYGEATENNANQRYRCIANPNNPAEGRWEQCPGCPLTVIPSFLGKADDYKKESAEFAEKVNQISQSVYQCTSNGGSASSCQTQANAQFGVTGVSQQYLDILKQQTTTNVQVYKAQNSYNESRNNYEVCKSQHAGSDALCKGYLNDANGALVAVGIDPAKAAEQLNEAYHAYIVNKASNLYYIAESEYAGCVAGAKQNNQKPEVVCKAQQAQAIAALSYPGTTSADQSAITKTFTDSKKITDILNQSGLTYSQKQKLIADAKIDPDFAKQIQDNWVQNIVVNVENGASTAVCKLFAKSTDSAKCDDPAFAKTTILASAPSAATSALQSAFKQADVNTSYINAFAGTTADQQAFYNAHKNDPIFKDVKSPTDTAAIQKALKAVVPDYVVEAVANAQATPQNLVEANPNSAYSDAYKKWRDEQIANSDSFDRAKSEEQRRAEFDAANQVAAQQLASTWNTTGSLDLNQAKFLSGDIVPLDLLAKQKEAQKPVHIELPKWGVFSLISSAVSGSELATREVDIPVKEWTSGFMSKTLESMFTVIPTRPDWYVKNQTDGKLATLELNPELKKNYLDSINASADAQAWMKTNKGTAEDYLAHNIEGYYKNEGVFAAGEYEKGTDSEQLFVEQVMLGNVNIDD